MHVIITALAYLLGTILWQRDAVALDYPTHPVRVIIPFTPGGAPDVLLRIVAQQLQEKWHQGVVVENRAGGNTLVGTVAAIAALFDEGVRLGCHVGVDSAHATGRQQSAGV